jgi:hypothetical protein
MCHPQAAGRMEFLRAACQEHCTTMRIPCPSGLVSSGCTEAYPAGCAATGNGCAILVCSLARRYFGKYNEIVRCAAYMRLSGPTSKRKEVILDVCQTGGGHLLMAAGGSFRKACAISGTPALIFPNHPCA